MDFIIDGLYLVVPAAKLGVHAGRQVLVEGVVELDNILGAAEIVVKQILRNTVKIFLDFLGKNLPVAVSPAIDALLHIAYDKVVAALRDTVLEQRQKVIPLNPGCILELVQKEMTVAKASLLVDERSVRTGDDVTKYGVGVVDAEYILLFKKLRESFLQLLGNDKDV